MTLMTTARGHDLAVDPFRRGAIIAVTDRVRILRTLIIAGDIRAVRPGPDDLTVGEVRRTVIEVTVASLGRTHEVDAAGLDPAVVVGSDRTRHTVVAQEATAVQDLDRKADRTDDDTADLLTRGLTAEDQGGTRSMRGPPNKSIGKRLSRKAMLTI